MRVSERGCAASHERPADARVFLGLALEGGGWGVKGGGWRIGGARGIRVRRGPLSGYEFP